MYKNIDERIFFKFRILVRSCSLCLCYKIFWWINITAITIEGNVYKKYSQISSKTVASLLIFLFTFLVFLIVIYDIISHCNFGHTHAVFISLVLSVYLSLFLTLADCSTNHSFNLRFKWNVDLHSIKVVSI